MKYFKIKPRPIIHNLKICYLIIATLLLLPFSSSAIDTAGEVPIKVRYLYSIDAKASGTALNGASSISVDNLNSELFILDRASRRVVITDLEGTFLYQYSFASAHLDLPLDMAVGKNGKVYFADTNHITIVDYDGKFIKKLDVSNVPSNKKIVFQSVGVSDKYIYVGDIDSQRILVFDLETTEYITEFKEGLGNNIYLAIDADRIFSLDSTGFSVYYHDLDGNPKGRFGKISGLPGGFSMPTSIAVDSTNGRVAVVDLNRVAVIFFDREGNFLYEFGGSKLFSWPKSIALDSRGRVYIGDGSGTVRVFAIVEDSIE